MNHRDAHSLPPVARWQPSRSGLINFYRYDNQEFHFEQGRLLLRGNNGPDAPRLILLDEAFVGIDSDMRGKCMGLLHEFDLDFVMTSEREWGCYSTMPGLAIYQLAARPEIDAVWASRWVWNGQERLQQEPAAHTPVPAPPAISNGHDDTSLFTPRSPDAPS